MKGWLKISLISFAVIIGLIIILKIVFITVFFSAMGVFDKTYNTADLIKNFNDKRNEIYDAKKYFETIVPKFKQVDIEFENDKIGRLVIRPVDTGTWANLNVEFQDWDIPVKSKKADSLLKVLGWSNNTLQALRNKLDDANCISIANGEPTTIGFKRSGMGIYSFKVFDKPISDSLKSKYNDSCTYVYANKYLVLEYGGGAVGPQCFPKSK